MKLRTIMPALIILTISASANAQRQDKGPQEKREEFASKQASHMADRIKLDDDTKTKFIDLYLQYQKEIWEAAPQRANTKPEDISEEQAKQLNEERLDHSRKLVDIRQKYYDKFSDIMTQKQIDHMYRIEQSIAKRLESSNKRRGHKDKPRERPDDRPDDRPW